MTHGRPPEGAALLHRLAGSAEAKQRLWRIVQTLTGQVSVADASAALGITPRRFHALRIEFVRQAVGLLELRPPGRPAKHPASGPGVAELEAELHQLRLDVQAARIREEIALAMPHLLHRGKAMKKVRRRKSSRPSPSTGEKQRMPGDCEPSAQAE